jgi:hypothetical protein
LYNAAAKAAAFVAFAAALGAAAPAASQTTERVSLDTTVEADVFRGQNALDRPNLIVDITGVVRIGGGWTAYVRPWFSQRRTTTVDKEIYQAALQYERPGAVATRINLGYIVSPVGLGLMDTRPGVNPLILPHLSYFTPMPPFEPGGAVMPAIASTYPLGGEVTLSGSKWDARAALVNSSPTRIYVLNNTSPNPETAPVLEGGAGVTPKVGLRIGASFAHGRYATDRMLTLEGIEGEYAFGYTQLSGEVTHDTLQTASGHVDAYEWFVQGVQTLTPRWFIAARQDGTSAPPPLSGASEDRRFFHTSEATLGYRVSPEVSLRSSFFARKTYTRTDWDQQVGVSLVWAHRWR